MKKIISLFLVIIISLSFFNLSQAKYSDSDIDNIMEKFYIKLEKEKPNMEDRINKLETLYSKFSSMNLAKLKPEVKNALSKIRISIYNQINIYKWIAEDITITIISDNRCENCNVDELIKNLKLDTSISWAKYEVKDFSDEWVKIYLKDNEIDLLPVIILSTNDIENSWPNWVKNFLEKMKTGEYKIRMQGVFDPYAEICDNKIDDDWNWKVDCEDIKCTKNIECLKKVDKPKAELFVMSHCPYWLQAQKWYLEVMEKLWNIADIEVKFVPYLMHWPSEWEENLVQHCIQKEQKEKYVPYLKCFLKEKWKEEECRKEVIINEIKLQACITSTKEKINYDKELAKSYERFPKFTIDNESAEKYWVQWSPSFVINGIKSWILKKCKSICRYNLFYL